MGESISGPNNNNWKGGRTTASNGYVLVRVGVRHHLADVRGYAYEHRIVAEEMLGRRLKKGEQVHHKNGNRQDNSPENIQAFPSRAHHHVEHRRVREDLRLPGEENSPVFCACGCNETFPKFDTSGRPRKFISGHNTRLR